MEEKNVYDRARNVLRDLVPLLHTIREHDKSLADQLKRAAQSVVLNIAEARGNDAGNARARFSTACGSAKEVRAALNVASDWGYIETHRAKHLDERLDEVCAITWCLGRRLQRPEGLQEIAPPPRELLGSPQGRQPGPTHSQKGDHDNQVS